ncbi:MAG: fibronectin type III domain-containing protein, partial [Woeseiaceae bacterium]
GSLSGTPAPGDAAVYDDIQITVSDGSTTSSLPAFSITVAQAAPGSVTLTWTAPTLNTDGTTLVDLSAYRVHYGTESGSYPNSIEISNAGITTYVIDNLNADTYYFVLTSLNSQDIESAFSNEASATIP